VDKIPAQIQPRPGEAVSDFDAKWDARRRVREILTGLGFHEAINQTLVGRDNDAPGRSESESAAASPSAESLRLKNPLSEEQGALRSSLVPGLLTNLRTNVSRHQYDVKLFEIGRVFAADGRESVRLALAVTGRREPDSWESSRRDAKLDFYDLKGALEELAGSLRAAGAAGAVITQIAPALAKKLDLRDAVYVAELELDPLLAATDNQITFRELPKFPAVVRDVALVVEENVSHDDVLAAIRKNRNKFLEQVRLFDIFRGGSIPTDKKSMAYSLTFRAEDRTLTDGEVNEAHDGIKRELQQALRCEIRES
jgi:phenylalanyl-tRNA synthetase beta chain